MASIRVLVRHNEVLRADQPELWVRGEQIPPGEERSFDVYTDAALNIEAKLTEAQEAAAKEVEEADKKVAEGREAEAKKAATKAPGTGPFTAGVGVAENTSRARPA